VDPSDFPLVTARTAEYSDLDPSRRIGRDTLVRWFEDARVALGRTALDADLAARAEGAVRLRVVRVRVDVLAPLRIAGDYRVGIGVSRIGTSSASYRYGVFAGDELVATGESVSVYVGDDGPAPLPEELREQLGHHRTAGPESPVPDRAEPRAREAFPFRVDMRARFGDLDTNRHVNNVRLATWYLDGLAELHLDVLGYPTGGPLDGLAPSTLCVQYLGEVHYPGIYQLRVAVTGIEDGVVHYACGLFDGPRCVGVAEAVGAFRTTGDDGTAVDIAATLEPFRLRG
jgi:acyl-CoA thioester hydrolase